LLFGSGWAGLGEDPVEKSMGKVTIAPNVLVTIVQKTADSVPGVDQLCTNLPGVKRWLGLHSVGQGVEVRIADDRVDVDVYLVAKRNVELLQMGRHLQLEVTRAIQDIVGMQVSEVNVHIEDIATELGQDRDEAKGQAA
jgi:uncharacterized alkaline shock family protein YloU